MRDIIGYEGLYAVTSCGKVWSYRSNKFLKHEIKKDGYHRVNLYKDGKVKHHYIHRLVAVAYIPNPNNLPQVDHINNNRRDNNINNLQWLSAYENVIKQTYTRAIPIRCVETGIEYKSIAEAARAVNRSSGSIKQALIGKSEVSAGFHWEYLE